MVDSEMGSLDIFLPRRRLWCKNVLSEIALLEKIFKVLAERPILRSSVSFVIVEGTLVSFFRASRARVFASRRFTQG